jgi:DNA-binding transcriptional LysR family regulator
MTRNLDTSLLRAFVAVAETAGMTAAAGVLHLTQAAVSQQIKRLEEGFGTVLFDRDRRGMRLTSSGERLLGKAKALLALNDDIWSDMVTPTFQGEVKLGIPYDLVGAFLPPILKRYASAFPQVEITLICLTSPNLVEALTAGDVDLAVVEEPLDARPGAAGRECLATDRLVWIGARHGEAYKRQPLPVSFCSESCAFRPPMIAALQGSQLRWRTVSEVGNLEAVSATVKTDLAVSALLASTLPSDVDVLSAEAGLPELPSFAINLYLPPTGASAATRALAAELREGFLGRQKKAA